MWQFGVPTPEAHSKHDATKIQRQDIITVILVHYVRVLLMRYRLSSPLFYVHPICQEIVYAYP